MQADLRIGDRDVLLSDESILIENIIDIQFSKATNTFTLVEDCDQYYTWDLTKEELIQFIKVIDSHFELDLASKY